MFIVTEYAALRLNLGTSRSQVEHSTTEPMSKAGMSYNIGV